MGDGGPQAGFGEFRFHQASGVMCYVLIRGFIKKQPPTPTPAPPGAPPIQGLLQCGARAIGPPGGPCAPHPPARPR
jgi:hypothetical protein